MRRRAGGRAAPAEPSGAADGGGGVALIGDESATGPGGADDAPGAGGTDGSLDPITGLVEQFRVAESSRQVADTAGQDTTAVSAPVVQIVTLLIGQAVRDRASDVHIEPTEDSVRVRFRIDGALTETAALPAAMGPALVSRLKIMAGMNIVERRRAQDGQIATEVDGQPVDVRVSTVATIWGEKAVLRLLDRSRTLYRLGELGMASDVHERFSRLVRAPYGMVICAGPTGSGKTTTLYATLSEISDSERNVMTIEDPVEYVFPAINQIQINEQAGLTFADGLRSIMRQDPDIILVGEIRDVETARIAVQSALTGHLVMTSLHATDAASALQRFVDMGVEPFLLASTVLGVVSQRLVRRICPHCRVRANPSAEELAFFRASGGGDKDVFWRGEGCGACANTGYHQRVGVFEVLHMTDAVRHALLRSTELDPLRAAAEADGMRTLRAEGIRLVTQDVTTIPEMMRSIYMA
jgi:type IV pilus assembly protein PilB